VVIAGTNKGDAGYVSIKSRPYKKTGIEEINQTKTKPINILNDLNLCLLFFYNEIYNEIYN
jgi:hypothetical protein